MALPAPSGRPIDLSSTRKWGSDAKRLAHVRRPPSMSIRRDVRTDFPRSGTEKSLSTSDKPLDTHHAPRVELTITN